MLDYKDELKLGTYNANFGQAWGEILELERRRHRRIRLVETVPAGQRAAGWLGDQVHRVRGRAVLLLRCRIVVSALLGAFRGKIPALIFAFVVPYFFAHFVY